LANFFFFLMIFFCPSKNFKKPRLIKSPKVSWIFFLYMSVFLNLGVHIGHTEDNTIRQAS